jgi:hypothetical protein
VLTGSAATANTIAILIADAAGEHGDAPHPLALLRACGKRPRGDAATEQRPQSGPS